MRARPITAWAFFPSEAEPRWSALDDLFLDSIASVSPMAPTLAAASQRWGRSRIAAVSVCEGWSAERASRGAFVYRKLGPTAAAESLRSAWALMAHDIADAVLLEVRGAEFLLERAGEATLQLRPDPMTAAEMTLESSGDDTLVALVVAMAAVEHGLALADPDAVRVTAPTQHWRVERRS